MGEISRSAALGIERPGCTGAAFALYVLGSFGNASLGQSQIASLRFGLVLASCEVPREAFPNDPPSATCGCSLRLGDVVFFAQFGYCCGVFL